MVPPTHRWQLAAPILHCDGVSFSKGATAHCVLIDTIDTLIPAVTVVMNHALFVLSPTAPTATAAAAAGGAGSATASSTGGGDPTSECLRLRVELDALKHESNTAKVALESQVHTMSARGFLSRLPVSLLGGKVRSTGKTTDASPIE